MLHHLWGKAKNNPDYNKEEWKYLHCQLVNLIHAAEAMLSRVEDYRKRGGTLTAGEEGTVNRLSEAVENAKKP